MHDSNMRPRDDYLCRYYPHLSVVRQLQSPALPTELMREKILTFINYLSSI